VRTGDAAWHSDERRALQAQSWISRFPPPSCGPRNLHACTSYACGSFAAIAAGLEKAREYDAGSLPNAADFAYPGPIPQSAETAVCMLADGIEAAVRVLAEPTPSRIRDVIEHMVRQRMEQGQLRDAPLTLRQIEIIKEQFARVLSGMYHSRIDYPASSGGISSEFASA